MDEIFTADRQPNDDIIDKAYNDCDVISMRYYIADCHFWHSYLLTRMDKRPFKSVEEMNEYMISQWNKKVRKNDKVVIIGDFCMVGAKETNKIVRQLNGKRFYLVTGNHDKIFLRSKDFDMSRFIQGLNEKIIYSDHTEPRKGTVTDKTGFVGIK